MKRAALVGLLCGLAIAGAAASMFGERLWSLFHPAPDPAQVVPAPPPPPPQPPRILQGDPRELHLSLELPTARLVSMEPLPLVLKLENRSKVEFQAVPGTRAATLRLFLRREGEGAGMECSTHSIGIIPMSGRADGDRIPWVVPAGATFGMRRGLFSHFDPAKGTVYLLEKPGRYFMRAELVFAADPKLVLATKELSVDIEALTKEEDVKALSDYKSVLRLSNPFPEFTVPGTDPQYPFKLYAHFVGRHPRSLYAQYAAMGLGRHVPGNSWDGLPYLRKLVYGNECTVHLRPEAALALIDACRQRGDSVEESAARARFEKETPDLYLRGRRYSAVFAPGNPYSE